MPSKAENNTKQSNSRRNSVSENTHNSISLPAVSVFQNKTESISQENVLQPKWIKAGDGFLLWDSLVDGVRWYHHQTQDLMYFDTVDLNVDVKYGKHKGKANAKPRAEWVNLRNGDDPMKNMDGGIKDATQDGSVTTDGYTLTPANVGFAPEMMMLWNYFLSKGLQDSYRGRTIHIIKAPGTVGKVCHHWSFGGLNPDFSLNIDQIHQALGGKKVDAEVYDENYPEEFKEKKVSWDDLNVDGLTELGSTSNSSIKIYNESEHSSRLKNGKWFHKFESLPFIFAVDGGDNNLIYGSVKTIAVKALNESALEGESTFSYVKN